MLLWVDLAGSSLFEFTLRNYALVQIRNYAEIIEMNMYISRVLCAKQRSYKASVKHRNQS